MRVVFRSEPKFLAVVTSLNAGRFSVSAKIPGSTYQFECEVFVGWNHNARPYPSFIEVFFRSGPKFLAVFSNSNARRFSVRTKSRGGFYQFECEAFFGQDQTPCRFLPFRMRRVCRAEPKFLAIITRLSARRFPARTEIPGSVAQFEREAFFGQSQNFWQYLLV